LSNVANSPDCAIFVTFDTFKFAAENRINVQRRDWTGVNSSSQSRKRDFLTLPDLAFGFVHKRSENEINVMLVHRGLPPAFNVMVPVNALEWRGIVRGNSLSNIALEQNIINPVRLEPRNLKEYIILN